MLRNIFVNVDVINLGIDVGTEMGYSYGPFDDSNDGKREMLSSDEGINLGSIDGILIDTILGNVYGITPGLDVGIELGSLDGSFDGSNDCKQNLLLLVYAL